VKIWQWMRMWLTVIIELQERHVGGSVCSIIIGIHV